MRVLLISKAMLSATAQRKAALLANRPDVELTVVSPPFWRADDGGKQRIEPTERHNWTLHVSPMWLNGHFHLHTYPTLASIVRDVAPDVVHIDEEPYNLATYQAMRIAKRSGALALFTTWQNLYRQYPPPFTWMEQYNYRHARYALAANEDAVAILRRKGYRGPVAVFPQFGVDVDLFVPRRRPGRDRLRVGFAGRLKPEKGVDLLLRAWAPLAARTELVLLGRGPSEPELRQLAQDLGVAQWVRFTGGVDSTQVAELMASLDVLVLPSRTIASWTEQFGRVLVEAMACEVAVIGSSAGEIPRVIGDAGLVFPEGDVDDLSACLRRLVEDSELRTSLAQRGRARALQYYAQDHIAEQTYQVWQTMLAM